MLDGDFMVTEADQSHQIEDGIHIWTAARNGGSRSIKIQTCCGWVNADEFFHRFAGINMDLSPATIP